MTESDDDSDCFESADEGFDDENIADNNVASEKNSSRTENSQPALNHDDNLKNSPVGNESNPLTQYRKRPERCKVTSKESAKTSARKISLTNQIFKADIMKPDVLIQDLSSNLSKNLNKGFTTIQQKSSSIKNMVLSSLPVTTQKTSDGFSYDEEYTPQNADEANKTALNKEQSNDTILESQNSHTSVESSDSDTELHLGVDKIHITNENNVSILGPSPLKNAVGPQDSETIKYQGNHLNEENDENTNNATQALVYNEMQKENLRSESDEESKLAHHGTPVELKKQQEENIASSTTNIEVHKNDSSLSSLTKDIDVDDYDIDRSKTELVTEDIDNLDNSKDGWDSTEIDLEELEVETNTASFKSPSQNIQDEIIDNMNNEMEKSNSEDNGWDDFVIDDEIIDNLVGENHNTSTHCEDIKDNKQEIKKTEKSTDFDTMWSGWDNFGKKPESKRNPVWNLGGWGVDTLLNTATSVTQGISSVLEAGLGAPDPVLLARMENQLIKAQLENETKNSSNTDNANQNTDQHVENIPAKNINDNSSSLNIFPAFGITDLVAGVTNKIVENARVHEIGSRVLSGGLDTLESVGRKTMAVLQDGDPGLKKKRALLMGSNKPVLSQILREAKTKAEEEDRILEQKQMAKKCHFETLFDDYRGLIHLEALEMLSKQCEIKLDQMKSSLSAEEVEDMTDIINEVKELCIIDEDEFKTNYLTMVDFKMALTKALEPLKNEINLDKIIQVYEDLDSWLKSRDGNVDINPNNLLQKAMSAMAELTAVTVQQFHKGGELLSVKEHRKTVEEAEALLQMTGFLCGEINHTSIRFLELHKSIENKNMIKNDGIVKKITEEAKNATTYIKDAFNLLIPVLQLGAAT